MPMALSSDLSTCFTPAVIPSRVSLSVPVERRIWSSSMVSEYFLAEPVRQDGPSSSVREVYIKLLRFEMQLDISKIALPLALVVVPRWGLDPKCACLHSCADCAGAATSCSTLLDARRSRSVCPEHAVSECSVPEAQRLTGGTLRVRRH